MYVDVIGLESMKELYATYANLIVAWIACKKPWR